MVYFRTQIFASFFREDLGKPHLVFQTGVESFVDIKNLEWSEYKKEKSYHEETDLPQWGDVFLDGPKLALSRKTR